MTSKYIYIAIITVCLLVSCKNARQEDGGCNTEEYSFTTDSLAYKNNDSVFFEEKEIKDISDFDIEFIRDVFAQEKIGIKKEDYSLRKSFLLTNIENGEDANSHLELFVYEISLHDRGKINPSFLEKLKQTDYISIYPATAAPHTCFLFMNDGKLHIIGYYGLYSYYKPFDIDYFISHIRNKLTIQL